ncbi:rhamnulokinase [Paenibacillus sp. CN-4]|uniref:rhamnulokinase n=1 Tax=Paenibacillus nanchangensis TaxID=3348343 RepID=UPI00397BEC08
MNHHIAVDIGASSGRLVLGTLQQGVLSLEEIYRFSNGFTEKDGSCYWDIDNLFDHILHGLRKAKAQGIERCTLGIDTWAVDYVLLDRTGARIRDVYAYRDRRTDHAPEEVARQMDPAVLYEKTGIQQLTFNTLYQLYVHDRDELSRAETILLVPDYLYYLLTGKKMNEVTNASTTQLLNLGTREFDEDLLALLGLKREQFAPLVEPGHSLGPIRESLVKLHNLPECELVSVPTHDTASAVAGVPVRKGRSWAYLSSGTWSLLGVERTAPVTGEAARQANYTNEWGVYGTYRFLKNIMGMWLIQEVRRLDGERYSYAELAAMAEREQPFRSLIPCNHPRFMNPDNMIDEIRAACAETNEPAPDTIGRLARCVFDSLALSYRSYLRELESLTGATYDVLQIVGGGANNTFLCQLTADVTGIEVLAGPTESTALGNLAVQMISSGEFADLDGARAVIADSFDIRSYTPAAVQGLEDALKRWERLQQTESTIH